MKPIAAAISSRRPHAEAASRRCGRRPVVDGTSPVAAPGVPVWVKRRMFFAPSELMLSVTSTLADVTDGTITSKIKAEVSAIEWDSNRRIPISPSLTIPPIRMRKAETAIALASGQTMAIGGLIANDITRDVTKIPFLGDLPVIGQLFRSTSFTKGETELIILVTPTIVDPQALVPPLSQDVRDHLNQKPAGGQTDVRQNQSPNR